MHLLLIEDDVNITKALIPILKEKGYNIDQASEGERGYFLASTNNYDLLILDYNLPKLTGRELIKKLRQEKNIVPILMLTVRNELKEKIDLFELGVDDYLTKPFKIPELLARITALLRRPQSWRGNILKIKNLELDHNKFLVTKNKIRIALSSKEFTLLEYLLANQGTVLSRQNIMEYVWDENADPFSNTIEVHIGNLRRKLETKKEKFIFTISNRGYKIDQQK